VFAAFAGIGVYTLMSVLVPSGAGRQPCARKPIGECNDTRSSGVRLPVAHGEEARMNELREAGIGEFTTHFRGDVLVPGNAGYD